MKSTSAPVISPNTNVITASVSAQPSSAPELSRQPKPGALPSSRNVDRCAPEDRTSAAPASRRPHTVSAAPPSSSIAASGASSHGQSLSENARSRSTQPNGATVSSQMRRSALLATTRTTNAAASSPRPTETARRRGSTTCATSVAERGGHRAQRRQPETPQHGAGYGFAEHDERQRGRDPDTGRSRAHRCQVRAERLPRGQRPGQHEFGAAGVLLAAGQPGGGQQRPTRRR